MNEIRHAQIDYLNVIVEIDSPLLSKRNMSEKDKC